MLGLDLLHELRRLTADVHHAMARITTWTWISTNPSARLYGSKAVAWARAILPELRYPTELATIVMARTHTWIYEVTS